MSLKTVKLKCKAFDECEGDHEIEVSALRVDQDSPHYVYEFTAKIEGFTYSGRKTVGSRDGDFVAPKLEQLQKDIDAFRIEVARHAHARHLLPELEKQIV